MNTVVNRVPDEADDSAALLTGTAALAHRLSDGAVALVTAFGLIGTTLIGLWGRGYWRGALFCLVIAAFGTWAIAARSTARHPWMLTVLRAVAIAVGSIATITLLFFAIGFALGNLRH